METLLNEEGLAKIMKVESDLLGDIRGLDGERKALVYDNYSKLIDATETIGRVREMLEVEALTGQKKNEEEDVIKQVTGSDKRDAVDGKGKLDDLVARVVENATGGQGDVEKAKETRSEAPTTPKAPTEKMMQKQTVRWVLATPSRLEKALGENRRDDALADWHEVSDLLDKWKNAKGTEQLRARCEELLNG